MLPADYIRCFGVLEDHSADQTCPRRHECARFISKDEPYSDGRFDYVCWALCDSAHDFFIRKYGDGE